MATARLEVLAERLLRVFDSIEIISGSDDCIWLGFSFSICGVLVDDGEGQVSVEEHSGEQEGNEGDTAQRVDEQEPQQTAHYGICITWRWQLGELAVDLLTITFDKDSSKLSKEG